MPSVWLAAEPVLPPESKPVRNCNERALGENP
jgi:hypothetical protein